MARSFNGSSQYLQVDTPAISGTPCTLAAWFKSNDITVNQEIMEVIDKDAEAHRFALAAEGAAGGDPVAAVCADGSFAVASTTSGYSSGVWHHGCAVFTSATSRAAFIDGGSKGTNATNKVPSGLDRSTIGRAGDISSPSSYFDGDIAEVAIWNVALTDEEVAIIGAGYSPLFVRPESLVLYMPLVREIHDIVGRIGMSNFDAATVAPHPAIITPASPQLVPATAFAPPTVFASQRLKIGHGR